MVWCSGRCLVDDVVVVSDSTLIQFLEASDNVQPFHTWLYFSWVTTATVGYGDVT